MAAQGFDVKEFSFEERSYSLFTRLAGLELELIA